MTPTLEQILKKSGIREGFMLVSAMHITAGVFVNDDESGLHRDIWKWLEGLAPKRDDYAHHDTGEDNGDAPDGPAPDDTAQPELAPPGVEAAITPRRRRFRRPPGTVSDLRGLASLGT